MPGPDSPVPSRLLKAIVAKFFIEIILICVVVSFAAFSNFSPRLRGDVEVVDQRRVVGWVLAPESPEILVEVQLFIDEKLIASKLANERRNDLVRAGLSPDPNHGFKFDLSRTRLAPGLHTAQVYALRQASGANKILSPIAKQPKVFEVRR